MIASAATLTPRRGGGGGGSGAGVAQKGASLIAGRYRLERATVSAEAGAAAVRLRRAAGLISSGSTSCPTAVARISRSTWESGSIVTFHEQLRHKMLSRYRAHGLVGASGHGEGIFEFLGPAKPDPRYPGFPGRNALREELVELGELIPVEVEGVAGKRYVVRDDLELLEKPPEPPPSVAFISPYDAFVWDRKLLGSLFDFDYVSELYIPPHKRRWGWYVLPIVFRDRLVGRIEPRIDAAEGTVQVLALWWENGFEPRRAEGFVEEMREALRAYLRFAKADRIDWRSELGIEKRLFGTAALTAVG
jgi:hypothetical protein